MSAANVNSEIYKANDITITREIANIKGVSYPVNGIGSIRVEAPNRAPPIILAGILVWVAYSNRDNPQTNVPVICTVIAVAAIGYAYRMLHALYIHTASSDRLALKGNKDSLFAVKEAIETAVTLRG